MLRRTRDLAAAAEAASGTRARLLNRLGQALGSLKAVKQDLDAYKDADEVRALVQQCEDAVSELRALLDA